MSDKASEAASDSKPFVESDDKPTQLGYDKGGVPFYVAALWVAAIIAYLTIMLALQLPDFLAWQRQ